MIRVNNGTEFRLAFKIAKNMTESDFEEILKKLTIVAFRELVERTAEDSGFAKGNWDVVVDKSPPNTKLKNPGGSHSKATMPIVNVKADSIIVLYNNTEYIIYLEQGTPKMRAQPMVRPTAFMVESLAKRLSILLSGKKYNV